MPGVCYLEYVNWTAVPLSTIQALLCSRVLYPFQTHFVVVSCLLVCKPGVLDAVLDRFGMSVRECEVASIVWVFHEAVVDIVPFGPSRFDGTGVVFVGIVGVVGVSLQEECGGGFEGLRACEDVFEGAVGVQAQFAAFGLDAVWCAIVGV